MYPDTTSSFKCVTGMAVESGSPRTRVIRGTENAVFNANLVLFKVLVVVKMTE